MSSLAVAAIADCELGFESCLAPALSAVFSSSTPIEKEVSSPPVAAA